MNTPLVQKGSVATAQIDQPELADVLQLDERMHSGDFRRVQNESIGGGSPHRTSPVKGVVFAVRFEPGAFFFWLIHQTVSTKNSRAKQKQRRFSRKIWFFVTAGQQFKVRCFGFIAVSLRIILTA